MNNLADAGRAYLTLRRRLGFELAGADRLIDDFLDFVASEGADAITVDLALRWATQPRNAQPATWAARLALVRRFAAFHRAADPRTEVPPVGLLPERYRRQTPYIYREDEVSGLLAATAELPSRRGIRALTYTTLFGLLAVTGMRVSEAVGLDREDVDLEDGVLTVRRSKFGATRLVPVHESTCSALGAYGSKRDTALPALSSPAFFVSEREKRVTVWSTRYNFALASQRSGLREPTEEHRHGRGPRLHDLRHRFAALTLLRWYRAGLDVEREMHKLSTYLGHAHVNDTYWYLEAVPELLALAAARVTGDDPEVSS
jgi:integrase